MGHHIVDASCEFCGVKIRVDINVIANGKLGHLTAERDIHT